MGELGAGEQPSVSRLRPLSSTTWRAEVRSEACRLEDELRRVELGAGDKNWAVDPDYVAVKSNVADALEASKRADSGVTWVRRWWSGTDVESAWRALHGADQALLMIQDEDTFQARLADLRAAVTANISDTMRADDYNARLDGPTAPARGVAGSPPEPSRATARVIKQSVDSAGDIAHSDVRNYRNWLIIVALLLCIGLTVIGVVHFYNPEFLQICQAGASAPGRDAGCVGSADVVELELLGSFGGLVAAFFALSRLQVYSGHYALPLWQAAIRVPAGAAGGVLGALLLQNGLLSTLTPQTAPNLVAWAALFGYAPDFLLRFLDQKVNAVSAAARTKNDPRQQQAANDTRAGRAGAK